MLALRLYLAVIINLFTCTTTISLSLPQHHQTDGHKFHGARFYFFLSLVGVSRSIGITPLLLYFQMEVTKMSLFLYGDEGLKVNGDLLHFQMKFS